MHNASKVMLNLVTGMFCSFLMKKVRTKCQKRRLFFFSCPHKSIAFGLSFQNFKEYELNTNNAARLSQKCSVILCDPEFVKILSFRSFPIFRASVIAKNAVILFFVHLYAKLIQRRNQFLSK